LVEPVSAAYLVIDRVGKVVSESSSAAEVLRCVADGPLTGRSLFDFFVRLPASVSNYEAPDSYLEFEAELKSDGSDCFLNVGIFPSEHHNGEEPVNLVFIRDVTAQRMMENELSQASRHYWTLFDASSDAIFLETADGSIFDCNKACEKMYGYSQSELLKMNARDLVPGSAIELIENCKPELESARASGRSIQLEAAGRRKDGSVFPSEVIVNFIKINGHECYAVAVRDITIRRELENSRVRYETQVMQLQKLDHLGQMASGLANDFNNLLTGIMGYSDLMMRELPSDSGCREKARRIVDAARKASEIIQQLMAYSGRMPTLYQKAGIKNILRELHPAMLQLTGSDVDLQIAVDENLPEIHIDPPMLKQAILNVVKNSVESAVGERKCSICITAFPGLATYYGNEPGYFGPPIKSGSYIAIKITDNGSGIDPENLNRIFDPFFTTRYAGRGLGLSAVIGMLRSHRGAVMVTSQLGHGTDFAILLPVDSAGSFVDAAQSRPVEENFPSGCALVIDDDENVREILADNIRMMGYEVILAENGKDGLNLFKNLQRKLTIVLTDLLMPGMSGLDLIKEIRWMNPEIPVIVCTGIGNDEKRPELEKLGVSAILEKPFSSRDLEKHLTRIQLKARNRNNQS